MQASLMRNILSEWPLLRSRKRFYRWNAGRIAPGPARPCPLLYWDVEGDGQVAGIGGAPPCFL